MSNASAKNPEQRYERIVINETEAYPAPGDRMFAEGDYIGRSVAFPPYDKELLGRDFLVAHGDEKLQIDARDRILGVLSRETPTMTMASVYKRFLDWGHNLALIGTATPVKPQNLLLVLSGPGVGKTHLPTVISKAFGYAHELIGSGEAGGDIDELVIAHEFKGNSAGGIFKKIEEELSKPESERLETYDLLVAKLDKAGFLDEAVDTERGTSLKKLNLDNIMQVPEGEQERTTDQVGAMEKNIQSIWKIAKDCHLDVRDAGGGIGVQKVNGRLLQKLLDVKAQYERSGKAEPVIITLDEFNRFKSFGKKLQNFWEVVSGTRSEPVKLTDASGVTHTFTPDMLRYVYVYLTGNDPKKVASARELDHSMLDRIGEQRTFRLDDFSVADWQHRLEQQLAGIGIDMHYRAGADGSEGDQKGGNIWDDTPDDFTRHLLAKREQGVTPAERLEYTKMQRDLLENWDKVHRGTGQVGQFFSEWSEIYKKSEHRKELADMTSKPEITARLMIHMVNDLRSVQLGSVSARANRAAKAAGKATPKQQLTSANLGTRLSTSIKDMVDKTHPRRDSALRKDLYAAMYKNGIVSKEEMAKAGYDVSEMLASGAAKESVANLLNCDPNRLYDKELKPLQEAIAEVIRQRYPEHRDKPDTDLVTLEEVQKAVESAKKREQAMKEEGRPSDMPPVFRRLLVPDVSISEKDGKTQLGFVDSVLVEQHIFDAQIPEKNRKEVLAGLKRDSDKKEGVVTTTEVLLGLALATDTPSQLTELLNPHLDRSADVAIKSSVYQTSLARFNREGTPASKTNLEKSKRELEAAISRLDPESKETSGDVSFMIKGGADMLACKHPSGLDVTVLKTTGYTPAVNGTESRQFDDALSIISVRRPDTEDVGQTRADVLIVGYSPIPEGLKNYLKEKRQITYVNARAEGAKEEITSSVNEIIGIAKARLQAEAPNHPDMQETDKTGLLYRTLHALKVRTPDDTAPLKNTPSDAVGKIVHHLTKEDNNHSTYNRLQQARRTSWQELVSGESGPSAGNGRAA